MKRFLIIQIGLMCWTWSVQAQNAIEKITKGATDFIHMIDQDAHPTGMHTQWDLYLAPKAGLTVSNLRGSGGNVKLGFNGGAVVEVFVLPRLAVDFEMTYSVQGTNNVKTVYDYNGQNLNYNLDYRLEYLNTYYLCRWYPKRELPLSIYSGLHIYRLINAKSTGHGTTTYTDANGEVQTNRESVKADIKKDLRDGDFDIPLGVSYEWGQWQADLRYDFSFIRLAKSDAARRNLGHVSNNMLSLTVAYKIFLW